MARRELVNQIVKLYQKLGGNLSDTMGTRTNVNFIGKGEPDMLKMDLNPEALGVLPQSKAIEELKESVSFATAGKLNDLQAGKLLENMSKMDNFYNPKEVANITDLATKTTGLDKAGLMSLRESMEQKMPFYPGAFKGDPKDLVKKLPIEGDVKIKPEDYKKLVDEMDLPPPGSRGGADDIAQPTMSGEESIRNLEASSPTGAGLELLKNVKNNNLIIDDLVNKIYLNAGVAENAQPVVRANAREFLNRVKDLTDEPGAPSLSSVMEADDFKFMTEGGGGGMGDPLLLVQKYFGPKVASAVAKLDGPNDIQLFAERLISVKDAKGRGVSDRFFDPESVDIEDFEFADGGLARLGYRGGKLVGKALGMFKRQQALERGAGEGFAAAEAYGITGKDVTRLFKELAMDDTLVGAEKTQYMKLVNEVLKNPEKYPEEILQIQKKLGIDIGMKGGGLAKILEV